MNVESSSGVGSSNGEKNVPGDDNNVSKEVVDEINTRVKSDNALKILSTTSSATGTFKFHSRTLSCVFFTPNLPFIPLLEVRVKVIFY